MSLGPFGVGGDVIENYEEPRRPILGVAAVASVLTTACIIYAASVSSSPRRFVVVVPFAIVSLALLQREENAEVVLILD